jgi:DNA mismatch endonuclease (patch repair protein)
MSAAALRRSGARDPAVTSRIMSRVKHKNTKPELALRRALHARGARYRLHAADVLGKPDVVVRWRKLAVFIDGDLWHGNPHEWERRGRDTLADMFPSHTRWWVDKIERNVARDLFVTTQLRSMGWTVVRLWESDVMRDPAAAAAHVLSSWGGEP